MEIIGIFPTPVGIVNLRRNLTDVELNFIQTLDVVPNQGNYTSQNNYVLNSPDLADLRYLIWEQAQIFFNSIYVPLNKNQIRITQSWINYNPEGGYHHYHAHPNSIISGVYYISGNKNEGQIIFSKEQYTQIHFESKETNDFNTNFYYMNASTNRLILFPSSLHHRVEKLISREARISLSFNTFTTGILGSSNNCTELIL